MLQTEDDIVRRSKNKPFHLEGKVVQSLRVEGPLQIFAIISGALVKEAQVWCFMNTQGGHH